MRRLRAVLLPIYQFLMNEKLIGSTWTTTDERNLYHFVSKSDEQNMRGEPKLESYTCALLEH